MAPRATCILGSACTSAYPNTRTYIITFLKVTRSTEVLSPDHFNSQFTQFLPNRLINSSQFLYFKTEYTIHEDDPPLDVANFYELSADYINLVVLTSCTFFDQLKLYFHGWFPG